MSGSYSKAVGGDCARAAIAEGGCYGYEPSRMEKGQAAESSESIGDKKMRFLDLFTRRGTTKREMAILLELLPADAKEHAVLDWVVRCADSVLLDDAIRRLGGMVGPV
jgi:hypothetical protein